MTERRDTYKQTGVDTEEAEAGLGRIVARFRKSWPASGRGHVVLPVGYFANVIDLGVGGLGLALCTDGVGSKTMIADMLGKYDTIGIDCVAMNVNDLICVGATPLSLVDYLAIERADREMIDAIGMGLAEGAEQAGITITGGETAQLRDIVNGFDLVGTAVGTVQVDRVITGQDVVEGDVVIGVRSSGVHSNGLSLARRVFFEQRSYHAGHHFPELGTTIGEELLKPTHIYVQEALEIIAGIGSLKAMANMTGDGMMNLARVGAEAGFVIDDLTEPQPVFALIQALGEIDDAEMYQVFNMGVGFCYVVGPQDADRTLAILKRHGREAKVIGRAVADPEKRVWLPQRGLVGKGKWFERESSASPPA